MPKLRWRFREFLDHHGIKPYEILKTRDRLGMKSPPESSIYELAQRKNAVTLNLVHIGSLLVILRTLVKDPVDLNDLFELDESIE
jgi:hypothetical protein